MSTDLLYLIVSSIIYLRLSTWKCSPCFLLCSRFPLSIVIWHELNHRQSSEANKKSCKVPGSSPPPQHTHKDARARTRSRLFTVNFFFFFLLSFSVSLTWGPPPAWYYIQAMAPKCLKQTALKSKYKEGGLVPAIVREIKADKRKEKRECKEDHTWHNNTK